MRGKRRTLKSMSNTFRKDRTTDELAEGGRAQRITGSSDIVVVLGVLDCPRSMHECREMQISVLI